MKQVSEQTGIYFFKVDSPVSLTRFLMTRDYSPLVLTPQEATVREWLEGGCVYVDGERRREDVPLNPEQIIRLHTRPKRYLTEANELKPLIVFEHEEFLVLDKPPGLPTHPTLDNFRDNAKVRLEQELGVPILTTHRLDVPTQGLLLFAKTAGAQRLFNKSFSLGRIEKIYRCVNERAIAAGLYTHFIDPAGRVPRPISEQEHSSWWRVQLEVLTHGERTSGLHWHEIKLLTGKTHQIRAQMSALGAPILGDAAYGGGVLAGAPANAIALECFRLAFKFRSQDFVVERPRSLRDQSASS